MLKLTNSFYRYLTITCKVDCEVHVKKYSHMSCLRYTMCQKSSDDFKLKKFSEKFIQRNSKKQSSLKPVKMEDNVFAPPLDRIESCDPEKTEDNVFNPLQCIESCEPVILDSYIPADPDLEMSDFSDDERDRPAYNTRNGCKTHKPLDFRRWTQVQEPSADEDTVTFKVVSYNMLAQCLLESHSHLYSECSSNNLKWKTRSARLYEEITALDPDIICFQEVQKSHLNTFYARFNKIGYGGLYKQKTGDKEDGCAIYFKESVFRLVDSATVEFFQPNLKLLDRHNIGLMARLAPVGEFTTRPELVVATTHLLYNPRRTDVRLAQMQLFLAEIDRFAFCNSGEKSGHLPVILTGDFNSEPDNEVVSLVNDGHVVATKLRDNCDWEQLGVTDNCQHLSVYVNRRYGKDTTYRELQIDHSVYQSYYNRPANPDTMATKTRTNYSPMFNHDELFQTLNFVSVYYKAFFKADSEVSTFQDRWVTVDYIFFSVPYFSQLKLTHRLDLPTAAECRNLRRLPNDKLGSDHLMLAAVFELSPRNQCYRASSPEY